MVRVDSIAAVAAGLAACVLIPGSLAADPHPPTVGPRTADPDAPAGAPPDWLPNEPWVLEHWLPYNEATMLRLLHTDLLGVQQGLRGSRTLWQFAERRGIDPERVLRLLVRPWRRQDRAREGLMLQRARRTFIQPHLAVHMLFHYFHIRALDQQWSRIFGVGVDRTFHEMYARGLCYLQVGVRHRGSARLVRRDMLRLLRRVAREGVRRHETLPSEARRFVAMDRRLLPGFLKWKLLRHR